MYVEIFNPISTQFLISICDRLNYRLIASAIRKTFSTFDTDLHHIVY